MLSSLCLLSALISPNPRAESSMVGIGSLEHFVGYREHPENPLDPVLTPRS